MIENKVFLPPSLTLLRQGEAHSFVPWTWPLLQREEPVLGVFGLSYLYLHCKWHLL